jgi:predicted DNA-binding protein (MmcQ/YjbR family)
VKAADVRARCLALRGAEESYPFGPEAAVFKVGGKVFAILGGEASVSLKCDPLHAVALRQTYPAVSPGYHLNKQHWNTVALDGSVPDALLGDWIEDSYDLILSRLPKQQRLAL